MATGVCYHAALPAQCSFSRNRLRRIIQLGAYALVTALTELLQCLGLRHLVEHSELQSEIPATGATLGLRV